MARGKLQLNFIQWVVPTFVQTRKRDNPLIIFSNLIAQHFLCNAVSNQRSMMQSSMIYRFQVTLTMISVHIREGWGSNTGTASVSNLDVCATKIELAKLHWHWNEPTSALRSSSPAKRIRNIHYLISPTSTIQIQKTESYVSSSAGTYNFSEPPAT